MLNEYLINYEKFMADPVGYSVGSPDSFIRRSAEVFSSDSDLQVFSVLHRSQFVERYSFSIPSDDALGLLAAEELVVEIGAGSGYWGALVESLGGNIIMYDTGVRSFTESWGTVHKGDASSLMNHPGASLFLAWPPYDCSMGFEVVETFLKAGGTKVFYAGELSGGCCGDERLFEILNENFVESQVVSLPQWYGINDFFVVYEK